MDINRIINEEISRFVNTTILQEKEEKQDDDKNLSNRRECDQYANTLEQKHEEGQLNYRKLASKIYGIPTDTSDKNIKNDLNSKASELRKKIVGDPGFNGGTMHLDSSDVADIESKLK